MRGGAEVSHIENMKYRVLHFSGALKSVRVPQEYGGYFGKLLPELLSGDCLGHVNTKAK